jgi:hypothetical protein
MMSEWMNDADRLALALAAIDVCEGSWRARVRVVEEAESAGQEQLTDAQDAEFRRLTALINNLRSPYWRPPVWACEEARQPVDGR